MKFSYTAVNSDGKREQGSLVAKSSVAAGHQLKERGLTPVNLKEEGGFSFLGLLDNILTVSLTEKLVFVENLELMMKSGVPVSRTLSILAKQTHNRQFSKVITGLYDTVENGGSLHEAMANYPKVFSDLFVSMVRVGEMSGSMELSLKQLGIQLEREADLRSRVKGAMIYPTVIVVAMIVMGVGMATFVLPKLTSVFKDFETTLPFATQMVVNATDFFAAHAILVMIALVGGLGGIFLGVKFNVFYSQLEACEVVKRVFFDRKGELYFLTDK
jgi:MSHA biogenesis protein MshG